MNRGIVVVIYPVKDLAKAKELFRNLLGTEPYTDSPFYVGFRVGDQEIGLDPNGHKAGLTNYFRVDDIRKMVQFLKDSGAQILQEVKDVGPGRQIVILKNADGNIIGLQN